MKWIVADPEHLGGMRLLLDENMPESVRRALRSLGHEADSVVSLPGFAAYVHGVDQPGSVKVIRVHERIICDPYAVRVSMWAALSA